MGLNSVGERAQKCDKENNGSVVRLNQLIGVS